MTAKPICTKYFDPAFDADRERGYQDAIAGRKSTTRNATSINAYSTGYEEGYDKRQLDIRAKRQAAGKALSKKRNQDRGNAST